MGAFWSPPEDDAAEPPRDHGARGGGPSSWSLPTAALVACSLAIAAAAGPIYALSERTAARPPRPRRYIDEVLAPMRLLGRVVLLVGALAARLGRDQPSPTSSAASPSRRRSSSRSRRRRHDRRRLPGQPARRRARLAGYVAVQLVTSNVVMTREILRRRLDVQPGVLAHRLRAALRGGGHPHDQRDRAQPGHHDRRRRPRLEHHLRPLPLPPRRRRGARRRSPGSSGWRPTRSHARPHGTRPARSAHDPGNLRHPRRSPAALFAYRLCAGPSLADRVIALNGLVLVGHGRHRHPRRAHRRSARSCPTLVAIALVGPISNGMIARFIEGRTS